MYKNFRIKIYKVIQENRKRGKGFRSTNQPRIKRVDWDWIEYNMHV
jgi:hypothetical protein